MNEIIVLLPAYNEEKNIDELVNRWQDLRAVLTKKYKLFLKIVLINDGSSDSTKEIGSKLEKKYDNFTLLNHEGNKGLGMAVKTGIEYIINNCPKSVFFCIMDCDNTQHPKYIRQMLQKQTETKADVVIASRYQTGASIKGVPKLRLLTCKGAKFIYSALLNVKNVRDYTCGYRLYKKTIIEKLYERFGNNFVEENGFACMAELLYKLYLVNASFSEVPFELRYDYKKGNSKMKVVKTIFNSLKLIITLKKIKKETR